MSQKEPILRCGSCGYNVASVVARDPDAPCPECGGHSQSDRIAPWPSPIGIAWQLVRVQACVLGALAVSILTSFLADAAGLSTLSGAAVGAAMLISLISLVVLVFWPISQAELLTSRHSPEQGRPILTISLVVLGWIGGGMLVLLMLCLLLGLTLIRR